MPIVHPFVVAEIRRSIAKQVMHDNQNIGVVKAYSIAHRGVTEATLQEALEKANEPRDSFEFKSVPVIERENAEFGALFDGHIIAALMAWKEAHPTAWKIIMAVLTAAVLMML